MRANPAKGVSLLFYCRYEREKRKVKDTRLKSDEVEISPKADKKNKVGDKIR